VGELGPSNGFGTEPRGKKARWNRGESSSEAAVDLKWKESAEILLEQKSRGNLSQLCGRDVGGRLKRRGLERLFVAGGGLRVWVLSTVQLLV